MKKSSIISLLTSLMLLCSVGLFAQIAIYGDTRTQDDIHQKVVNKIVSHNPQIVFHTGDLVNTGSTQAEFDKFYSISKELIENSIYHPAKGNHEKNKELFMRNFPSLKDDTYYRVDFDSLVFIILDSPQKISIGSQQYQWLSNELLQNQDKSIFLIIHHPVFSSGRHGDELGLNLYLPQLLSKHGVKAVFSGHDHGYERSFYDGVFYITTAGGGAPLYDQSSVNKHSQIFRKTYNYVIGLKESGELVFRVYDLEDKVVDSFRMKY